MKRLLAATLAAAAFSSPAFASPELAAKYDCMGCHKDQSKVLGPSFKDVATRYAGNKNAEEQMAHKIIKGGAGVWGPVPMPANAKIPAADARKLASWVLSVR